MKHYNSKFFNWINNKLRYQLSSMFPYGGNPEYLTNCALSSKENGITDEKYCDHEVIVSLTTFDRRLYEVYLAVESIMQQTMKPNRIILWVSDKLNDSDIPLILRKQQNRGLEIKYCKDIFSYTKLIPSLKTFPSSIIITIDDDSMYYFDLIENLFKAYKKNQKMIHCARMHRMKLINKNSLEKYNKWIWNYGNFDVSPLNFPTGVGGVLYPPRCFNEEVFNENVFLSICKTADDVWFKAMALLNGYTAQKIFTHNTDGNDYNKIKTAQYKSLSIINQVQCNNDVQLKAVFNKYNLYDKLNIK